MGSAAAMDVVSLRWMCMRRKRTRPDVRGRMVAKVPRQSASSLTVVSPVYMVTAGLDGRVRCKARQLRGVRVLRRRRRADDMTVADRRS